LRPMIYDNPFAMDGHWFRGNTHTHTTLSDGRLSPADRCGAYRQAGYDFLILTDHRIVCDVSPYSQSGFLVIPGCELHPPNPYGGDIYHIVGMNVSRFIYADEMHPNDVIAAVVEQGGLACLAHPYWSGHTINDYAHLRGYFAVEVYNTTCQKGIGKGFSESHWDDVLDRLGAAAGIATDDAHKVDLDVFGGWVMVRAPELTTKAIVGALARGAFYSTQGPQIEDIQLEAGEGGLTVSVRCSPVRSVIFKGRSSTGRHVVGENGQLLTEASYTCGGAEKYIRIELADAQGNKAWSNPFFLAEM